ncbi:MAG TPA: hypothetical protein VH558_11605 [Pseudolabrys sp.]|jgi:hypothetical protein
MFGGICVDSKQASGEVASSQSRWPTRLAGIIAIACTLVLSAAGSRAQSIAPFNRLAGQWSGSGSIDLANGRREPIRCRASYDVLSDRRNLQLNIRCASDSYNFDLRASATYSAGSVSGIWSESTRLVGGTISGRAEGDHIHVVARSSSFSASLTVVTRGARQSVVIKAQGADAGIKGVSMNLRRG